MPSTVATFVSTGATVPVGFNLFTDPISSGGDITSTASVEYVKLLDGASGSTTPLSISSNGVGNKGLQVNVTNSTSAPIGVSLVGGQSSVTVTGTVTVSFSNANSTTNAVLSTAGMGGSTGSPVLIQNTGWAPSANSTWANITITSTALATLFSSAASTRFNLLDIAITNQGVTETVVTVYDGSTTGTILFQAACASAGGGIVKSFPFPRPGSSGNKIAVEIVPASTVYIDASAYKSA